MNLKQIAILVVLLAVCLGGVLLVNSNKNRTVGKPSKALGEKVFPQFPINEIVKIHVAGDEGAVTLDKAGGTWSVAERGGYPADFTKVADFLRTLWDLKIADAATAGESRLGSLGLGKPAPAATGTDNDEASGEAGSEDAEDADDAAGSDLASEDDDDTTGLAVSLRQGEGDAAGIQFVLGNTIEGASSPSPFGMNFASESGRWLKTEGSGDDVWAVSETFAQVKPAPAEWLDKTFFNVYQPKTVTFNGREEGESWTLTRDSASGPFTLEGAGEDENFDEPTTGPIKNAFASPTFNDVVVDADPSTTGLDQPRTFHIETFEDFTYDIAVGDATDDGYYLTVEVAAELPQSWEPKPGDIREVPPEDADGDGEVTDEEKQTHLEAQELAVKDRERAEKNFNDKLEGLKTKLADEEKLEKHVFLVAKWSVDPLLKNRADFIKTEEEAAEAASTDATTPQGTADPTRPPITAVTPPIAVPSLDEPMPDDPEVPAHEEDATQESESPDPAADEENGEETGAEGGEENGAEGGESPDDPETADTPAPEA